MFVFDFLKCWQGNNVKILAVAKESRSRVIPRFILNNSRIEVFGDSVKLALVLDLVHKVHNLIYFNLLLVCVFNFADRTYLPVFLWHFFDVRIDQFRSYLGNHWHVTFFDFLKFLPL